MKLSLNRQPLILSGRFALRMLAWLLLGVVLNIAIAWAMTLRSPIQAGERSLALSDETPWPVQVPQAFPVRPSKVGSWNGGPFRVLYFGYGGKVNGIQFSVGEFRSGWPLRSMVAFDALWGQLPVDRPPGWQSVSRIARGIERPDWATPAYFVDPIPLQPIAGGFILNSTLFALVLWTPLFAYKRIRKRCRLKRGLCERCGYDLCGSSQGAVCPECGESRHHRSGHT